MKVEEWVIALAYTVRLSAMRSTSEVEDQRLGRLISLHGHPKASRWGNAHLAASIFAPGATGPRGRETGQTDLRGCFFQDLGDGCFAV